MNRLNDFKADTGRDGVIREDTRRNDLRVTMLSGLPQRDATVQQYGSLPSNKLQALTLNSK